MRDPGRRVNPNDPTGLNATADRRADILEKDLDAAAKRVLARVNEGHVTDPLQIDAIVEQEMSGFNDEAKRKVTLWIDDTVDRSAWRAEALITGQPLTQSAVPYIRGSFGGRPLTGDLKQVLSKGAGNSIQGLSVDARAKLTRTISEGVQQGEGLDKLTKRVQDTLGVDKARARTIAQTETLNAYRGATKQQYQRHGVEMGRWFTSGRERACKECQKLHNTVHPLDDWPKPHGGTDINCRCAIMPVRDK